MQPEEEIVTKPEPFEAEKFLAHLKRLNDDNPPQSFTGFAQLSNDDERIRDGAQREAYWVAQIHHLQSLADYNAEDMAHAREELGSALFVQGRINEALSLTQNPERTSYYLSIQSAIEIDDNEFCACPETEIVEKVLVKGEPSVSQLWHTVGYFPSAKHGGAMTPIQKCAVCGFTNVTNL